MTSFTTSHNRISMITDKGPINLTDEMCEGLLDIFEQAEGYAAASLYNSLYDAYRAVGGIERISSRRAA